MRDGLGKAGLSWISFCRNKVPRFRFWMPETIFGQINRSKLIPGLPVIHYLGATSAEYLVKCWSWKHWPSKCYFILYICWQLLLPYCYTNSVIIGVGKYMLAKYYQCLIGKAIKYSLRTCRSVFTPAHLASCLECIFMNKALKAVLFSARFVTPNTYIVWNTY